MKVIHVITGMRKAAGTSVFCGEVCNGLVALGHEVTIAVVNPNAYDFYPVDSDIKIISIADLVSGSRPSRAIIHIHALWSPILHKVARWARKNQLPIVWSPHGMVTSWAMHSKWWKKQLGWWMYQRWDLAKANLLHVTARSEYDDIRRMGLKNKIFVVPLGVEKPDNVEIGMCKRDEKVVLFVSRVQKKKGLMNLVRAWASLPNEIRRGWKVRVVGPDQEGHTSELKALCGELGVMDGFCFTGPKYGDELQVEYQSASLFVLPTYSENFGSVVIEALACGVPVITTKGAPWQELEAHRCGWWIDIGVEPLVAALTEAMSLGPEALCSMGSRGRGLVEESYAWDAVIKKMIGGYEMLDKDEIYEG